MKNLKRALILACLVPFGFLFASDPADACAEKFIATAEAAVAELDASGDEDTYRAKILEAMAEYEACAGTSNVVIFYPYLPK